MLSNDQKEVFIGLLLKGRSVALACKEMEISVWTALRAIADDAELARRVREVNAILSRNVAAALYHVAIKGNVTAQTFWLRSSPPPEWAAQDVEKREPQTYDEVLDELTDEELVELARALGVDLASEGEADLAAEADEIEPRGVPG